MGSEDKKTIVYMNNSPSPYLAGGEKHLLLLAKAAKESGFAVYVICQSSSGLEETLKEVNIETIPLNLMAKNFISTVSQVAGKLKLVKADILHTHGFFCNIIGRIAGKLAKTPVIVSTVHCEPDSTLAFGENLKTKFVQIGRDFADRFTSRYADAIVAVAEVVKKKLIKIGIPQEKIILIRNGIPIRLIKDANIDLKSTSTSEKTVIGTVGRLEPVKGLDYFIEAAALVDFSVDRQVNFLIVGEGSLRKHLENKAKEIGLKDKIIFMGYVEDTAPEIRRMNVFIVPSLSDTTNLALIEALALGKAVVATRTGGIPEVIEDKKTGLLVPPKNAQALADAILFLLENPEVGKKYAQDGKKTLADKFSAEKMCDEHLKLYNELINLKR